MAGAPGQSEHESIRSGWFDTLEEAKKDALKNSGVQVFSYPYLRYSQYRVSYIKKDKGIETELEKPKLFTFPYSSGNMLVFPRSVQTNAAADEKVDPFKQKMETHEKVDPFKQKMETPRESQSVDLGAQASDATAHDKEDTVKPKAALRLVLKNTPRKRGRPTGSKNRNPFMIDAKMLKGNEEDRVASKIPTARKQPNVSRSRLTGSKTNTSHPHSV